MDKSKLVHNHYMETKKNKKWLEKNTGKKGMSQFIREAVETKIERQRLFGVKNK